MADLVAISSLNVILYIIILLYKYNYIMLYFNVFDIFFLYLKFIKLRIIIVVNIIILILKSQII